MAKRLPALTARDKTSVRKTARELRAAYDRGEEDSLSETVVISSGYADVEIYPDDEDTAYVVRHGVTTSVPMSARRKTRKRKVLHWSEYQSNHVPMTDAEFNRQADVYYAKTGVRLHRNPSRKRVPSKRVANPTKKSTSLDAFTRAYIEAALFSSSDDDGRPLERNYSAKDILGATLAEMKRDCAAFQRENRHDLAEGTATQGGHDFWLTRNREGAGFWDGDWPEPAASNLTKSAHFYGSYDLYVSRGKIRH